MKLSAGVTLLAVGGAAAYSAPSRSSIRSLGSKSFAPAARRQVGSSMKMEGTLSLSFTDVYRCFELSRSFSLQPSDFSARFDFLTVIPNSYSVSVLSEYILVQQLTNLNLQSLFLKFRLWLLEGNRNRFRRYLGWQ